MAAATVTSPDPFTFHCPAAPSATAVAEDNVIDEFEFRVVPAAAAALSATDELFSGGKLVPLHRPAPASAPCSPPPCHDVDPAASASEPMSRRAPRCAGRRWRDLLHLVSSSSGGERRCGLGLGRAVRGSLAWGGAKPSRGRRTTRGSRTALASDASSTASRPGAHVAHGAHVAYSIFFQINRIR
ncbi:unnamed protein product [Urochloa humidicola]